MITALAKEHTKYIFVTGGVCSSLGKGTVAAAIGALLENRGLKICLSKADPYINVDPGTMSPAQHGEVFVTEDGAETDLDVGHYERFTHTIFRRCNSFSTGQVYDAVLNNERKGVYLGGTVQVVPHITTQIKNNIYRASESVDISIIEIGGTVGDIEGQPFLETIRQMRYELGADRVLCVHLTLVPYLKAAQELKTKPTQHSVKELRSMGIQPDLIVCRAERSLSESIKDKIALFCNLNKGCVIEAQDLASIYLLPLLLSKQGLDDLLLNKLNVWARKTNLDEWQQIAKRINQPETELTIAVVGKYTEVIDSYKSIEEALVHAGLTHKTAVKIKYIDAEELFDLSTVSRELKACSGLIVPGGFGVRGVAGKILSIQYVRENKIPFLGICLGMQLAVVEFARNILKYKNPNSLEFVKDQTSVDLVIDLMEGQKNIGNKGGTMRLGAYPCHLKKGSKAESAYGQEAISERHRHRYEFNNKFKQDFIECGMDFSGMSPNGQLVEVLELREHPWFLACQFHPELQSKPMCPHPLFSSFLKQALLFNV